MTTRRFEFIEGTSRKFWEIAVDGPVQSVRFGRIGSEGLTDHKRFGSPAEARAAADKLVAQKLKKGYRETGQGAAAAKQPKKSKPNPKQTEALIAAAKEGDAAAIGKLLAAGAQVNAQGEKGETALMWAARNGEGKAISALLAAGADPNLEMESNATALTIAVRRGEVGAVKLLIAGGADLSGAQGQRAMERAVDKGNTELVVLLGKAGLGDAARSAEFLELFGFLAASKKERELLEALSFRVTGLKRSGKGLTVKFGDEVVTCEPGAKVKAQASVPKSYRALAARFNGIDWDSPGGGSVGFPGCMSDGSPAIDYGWDSTYLANADKLIAALKKRGLELGDLTPAFGAAQNWVLFDPTRKNKHGEPALAFVSHESCEWEPVKSADRLTSEGVLLQLLAQSFLGTGGLDEVSL